MKRSLPAVVKSPFLLAYLALYIAILVALRVVEGFDVAEPIMVLLVIGVGFSAIAWWITRRSSPLPFSVKRPVPESVLLAGCLLLVTAYITWGLQAIQNDVHAEPLKSVVILATKLVVFVLVPFLLLRGLWKYTPREITGLSNGWRRHLNVALWMSLLLVGFQVVFGRGPSEIQQSGLPWWSLALGAPFAYLWLILEVGLVEEFFFRVLIQSRLAALTKSETGGVVLMAVLFGLAHAPGMYLRTGSTLEALGPSPSLFMAVGYAIVVTSVAGFFLGVLWVRTRNLPVLMLVHAAGDLVPGLVGIVKVWLG
jgi:uncharacterized protein